MIFSVTFITNSLWSTYVLSCLYFTELKDYYYKTERFTQHLYLNKYKKKTLRKEDQKNAVFFSFIFIFVQLILLFNEINKYVQNNTYNIYIKISVREKVQIFIQILNHIINLTYYNTLYQNLFQSSVNSVSFLFLFFFFFFSSSDFLFYFFFLFLNYFFCTEAVYVRAVINNQA